MRLGRRAALLGALAAACGRAARPVVPAAGATPSHLWMKRALDPLTCVTIACDVRASLADEAFASATRRGLRVAADRAVEGAALEKVVEAARGAIVSVGKEGDVALVLLGVDAALEPESLHGWDAAAQWKRVDAAPPGTGEWRYAPVAGSLFVLSDRTWAVGAGLAAQRLRAALAEAGGAPVAELRLTRPIELHVPGPRVADVRRRVKARALAPLFDELRELTVGVALGKAPTLHADLVYPNTAEAQRAAAVLQSALRALDAHPEASLGWLGKATAGLDAERLTASVSVPSEVLKTVGEIDSGLL